MMWSYILKLVVLLPLVCGLMIGCLYAWRRLESRLPGQPANRLLKVTETMMISPSVRLAVIDFGKFKLRGALAWWIWGIAHIYFLIGLRHRLGVALSWLWIYARDQRAARLITQGSSKVV